MPRKPLTARPSDRKKARTPAQKRRRLEGAFRELLAALGSTTRGEIADTPSRAAALWMDHLLAGEHADLARILSRASRVEADAPVSVFNIGVHLVCPHHLTVAFGEAHLAYLPHGRIAGFGALADLVAACTARLVLQENATTAIAEALVTHLGARAAVAVIEATHPCHNIVHPRSHRARALTWAGAGDARAQRQLRQALTTALAAAGREMAR